MKIAENITPEELELIDAFLMDHQTSNLKTEFANKMQTDAQWGNKIDTIRLIQSGISEAAFKKKLEEFHNEITVQPKNTVPIKKLFSPQKIWWAAASVIALVFIGFFILKNDKYENAYANYYQPDPGLITAMAISNNYNFEEGMVQYKNGKFDKALELWKEPSIANPQNDTLLYFTASAYQALKQTGKATGNYLKILQQNKSSFYQDASWYLGLIYLENKEIEKAKPLLLQSGKEEVTELLQKIK